MISLNYRQKFFLTFFISAAAAAGAVFGFVMLLAEARKETAAIERLSLEIVSLEKERGLARDGREFLRRRGNDIAEVKKNLVNKDRPVEFIEALESAGKAAGGRLALELDSSRREEKALFFRLAFEGSETAVRKYLKLVELLPYEIKIEDLNFQTAEQEAGFSYPDKKRESLSVRRLNVVLGVKTFN